MTGSDALSRFPLRSSITRDDQATVDPQDGCSGPSRWLLPSVRACSGRHTWSVEVRPCSGLQTLIALVEQLLAET